MTLTREPVAPTPRKGFARAQRERVVEAQLGLCEMCGHPLGERFDIDHRLALFQGGKHEPSNWRAVHRDGCHPGKGDATVNAKLRRLIKKNMPAGERPEKKGRKLQGRGFSKTLRKLFTGKVVIRDHARRARTHTGMETADGR